MPPLPNSLARRAVPLAFVLLLVAGCGGGGGGGSSVTTPPPPAATPGNSPPLADAGADQTVDAGAAVILDASASSDSDGSIRSWSWLQTDGPTVALQSADQPQATFTAPLPSVDTELVFRVTIVDDDGAQTFDSVRIAVATSQSSLRVDISGTILPPVGQDLDGDTNDPNNRLLSNDDPTRPQPIGNPTTLGGYVNEPGSGASGRSSLAGDREDYFSVDLLAGQRINLLVADFADADADLYLYSPAGELIDFSIETGEVEELVIAESGRYVVNVSIFTGASNYTLAVGAPLGGASRGVNYDDVLPWQSIVTWTSPQPDSQQKQEDLTRGWEVRRVAGDSRRAQLLALSAQISNATVLTHRLGDQAFRRTQFRDPARGARWETLLSIKRLARHPAVASAEPNYRLRPSAEVNDEAFPFQWHYPLINLPGAWETSSGSADVVVAVIDTGVLGSHPDLQGQLLAGYDFVRNPQAAGDGDGIDPNPEEAVDPSDPGATNFHGTHVAGTVAAAGDNGIGVVGVAYGARVMPLRALTNDGGTSYDVLQAVRYAAGLDNDSGGVPARPADIINLSLGGGGFSQVSQDLYNELRNMGIAVVAAAGNEGSSVPGYPAAYDNVISVSAVDVRQSIAPYSNRGATIDVAAPGGDGSRDINGDGYPDGVLSTGGAEGRFAYTFLSGTSMAAPHVAGVLALMKSVNPGLTADAMERLLGEGQLTRDLGAPGRDDLYGHGLIDARRAVEAALAESGDETSIEPRLASSTSTLNFGSRLNQLEFLLSNRGSGDLGAVAVAGDQPWLEITPLSTDTSGLGRYAARVDRSELASGIYEGSITAVAASNSVTLRVFVGVTDGREAELGTVYLLLFDPIADRVVSQADIVHGEDGYRYLLADVPPGSYELFAGTDLDNDLLICDAGEACGAFLTIEDPLLLQVEADRDAIDFTIEYLVSLPGAAANNAGATPGGPQPLQRKKVP